MISPFITIKSVLRVAPVSVDMMSAVNVPSVENGLYVYKEIRLNFHFFDTNFCFKSEI